MSLYDSSLREGQGSLFRSSGESKVGKITVRYNHLFVPYNAV